METNKIYQGNTLELLKQLEPNSIDCIITSPPYWGLRDYGKETETIWDANKDCIHKWEEYKQSAKGGIAPNASVGANRNGEANNRGHPTITNFCSLCGAWKGQLGLEPDFKLYIKHLCDIFDEARKALKSTGTCWVNLGDTYAGSGGAGGDYNEGGIREGQPKYKQGISNMIPKTLIQIPNRFSIEMSDRGWILRNDIIWWKPNCMPSSAKDRFTNDYEHIFFFTKSKKYYFEQQIEESVSTPTPVKTKKEFKGKASKEWMQEYQKNEDSIHGANAYTNGGRNMRAVWSINLKPHPFAHFAVYPEELIKIPILAGSPKGGIVLDIFAGSGTTAIVSRELKRDFIGFDINSEYVKIAEERIKEASKQVSL